MQRLTGLDAAFLSLEVPSAPMHVASIIVLDPSTVEGGVGPAQLRALYEKRVHLAPPFRRRLVEIPFGIHHPIWIEDPDFDLGFHLRHIAVPAPGTMDELSELAGHLVAMPLDRRRPLWEVWLITGLENGHVAVLTKVHHAAIDGASGEELMIAILDLTPEIEDKPLPDTPWAPDRVPTDTELFSYAIVSLLQNPLKLAKATRRTLEAALQIRQENRRQGTAPPPAPFSAPRTSFNHPVTPHRHVTAASLSLPDVKLIKNAFGVTVNDVVMTLCGGALRHYLDEHGEHPDRSLVAMVPVSVRTEDTKGTMGNELSATLTTLGTGLDDPLERLLAVSSAMRRSKDQFNTIGADTLQNWTEFAAPAVLGRAARLYSRMKIADAHRPLFNVVLSNIPGPPFPLYIAGGLVKAVYPIGPIYNGAGVNLTVMSYLDSLDFGINTCPELVPEPERIAQGLHHALTELKDLAQARHHTSVPATEPAPAPEPESEPVAEPRTVTRAEPEPEPQPVTPIEAAVEEAPEPEPEAPRRRRTGAAKAPPRSRPVRATAVTKATANGRGPAGRGTNGRAPGASPSRASKPAKKAAARPPAKAASSRTPRPTKAPGTKKAARPASSRSARDVAAKPRRRGSGDDEPGTG